MNEDTKNTINWCATCLEYQQTQPQEKKIPYEVPCMLWDVVGTDIFLLKVKPSVYCRLLQQVSYYKKANSLKAGDLVKGAKYSFAEFGLPREFISDAGTNFTSEMFIQFCRQMNREKAITSSYHHQSNCQMEACIKFINCTIKNASVIIMM